MSGAQKIIVIVGPTALGKSELGVRMAKKLNGEIISADSRQVYRGLDVGSGKIAGKWAYQKEQKGLPKYYYKSIRHHCIDIANPKKTFTAADFVKCGRRAIADILSRSKTPIIVGGTGFYIDALLGRVQLAIVPPNKTLRKKLTTYATAQLVNYLIKLDPGRAKTIDKNNPRRLIRAIEIVSSSKCHPHALIKSDSLGWQKQKSKTKINNKGEYIPPPSPSLFKGGGKGMGYLPTSRPQSPTIHWLGIKRSPEDLKKRIHKRLITRLPGIMREVKKLHCHGVSLKRLYDLGLEYRYVSQYIRAISEVRPPKTKNVQRCSPRLRFGEAGRFDLYTTMVAELQAAIWHYARRQMTWFRKNKEIRWIQTCREAQRFIS